MEEGPIQELLDKWDWNGWQHLREPVQEEYAAMKACHQAIVDKNAALMRALTKLLAMTAPDDCNCSTCREARAVLGIAHHK